MPAANSNFAQGLDNYAEFLDTFQNMISGGKIGQFANPKIPCTRRCSQEHQEMKVEEAVAEKEEEEEAMTNSTHQVVVVEEEEEEGELAKETAMAPHPSAVGKEKSTFPRYESME